MVSPAQLAYQHYSVNGTSAARLLQMCTNGNSRFGDYNLYVQNGILTEHVKVAVYTTSYWSDFVFNKNYKLMPLNKVEEFVKANKHLPGVPSAQEVVDDGGIDLGSMDAKLLQKVEELTLYVIQQQKQIDELQKKLTEKIK